jgi:hypothetical protein
MLADPHHRSGSGDRFRLLGEVVIGDGWLFLGFF